MKGRLVPLLGTLLPLVVLACDDPASDPSAALPTAMADVTAAPIPNLCVENAGDAVVAARNYGANARAVRNACRQGTTCDPEVENATTSFSTLEAAHQALSSACTPATAEICDDLDNDHDNLIDEDFPDKGTVCLAGAGLCLAQGFVVCTADASGTECSARPNTSHPDFELVEFTCDGLDNDCDGLIDEDVSPLCPLQEGVCNGSTEVCGGANGLLGCGIATGSYGLEYELVEVTVDGLDNDCDGVVDNT